ncbi:unnamed protein product [Protopolystoma xenopodis]|uniref:EGF-like domain-containing protein n=1 Tax=Protopolystoma xenopodis TaxID=117903 RepID=A0A3S5FH64_9PLAT|nr:unnamed protein product [Protopolystoma xenopodis]
MGWRGKDCSRCIPHPDCVQGVCSPKAGGNETTGSLEPYTCLCLPGWGGVYCSIDLDYCSHHHGVCRNQGVCLNMQGKASAQYRCQCPPGFRGDHCEVVEDDCQVHGCGAGVGKCVIWSDGKVSN